MKAQIIGWTVPRCLVLLLALLMIGCNGSDETAETETVGKVAPGPVSLNVLVIDDKNLGPVFKRQFGSRRNGQAELTEISWQELVNQDFEAAKKCDMIIYPANRLGELASRDLLVPITSENTNFEDNPTRSILFSDKGPVVSWAGEQVAMSLGQSHWVMLYHNDVLKATNRSVPKSWEQFDDLMRQLDRMNNPELPRGLIVPLQGHWASYALVARACSAVRLPGKYSSYFDVASMVPAIDSAPFHKSLAEFRKHLAKPADQLSPKQVLATFFTGKAAVAMVPINRHWLESVDVSWNDFAVGAVPGYRSLYDRGRDLWQEQSPDALLTVPLTGTTGMLASCGASSQKRRRTLEVMVWLTSKSISSIVSVESPGAGLSRKSHLANPQKWLGEKLTVQQLNQFADLLTEVNQGRRQMTVLRIPQADRYLEILDTAVRSVVLQDKNAVEELSAAAFRWNELTEQIGRNDQQKAYRQSEGLRD